MGVGASDPSTITMPTNRRSRPDLLIVGIVAVAAIGVSVAAVAGGMYPELAVLWAESLM